jgi:hypothetical protein
MLRTLFAVGIGLLTAVGAAAGLYALCYDLLGIPQYEIARDAIVSASGLGMVSVFSLVISRRRK